MRGSIGKQFGASVSELDGLDLWHEIQRDTLALMVERYQLRSKLSDEQEKAARNQKKLLLEMLDVLDHLERVFANIAPREETAERQAKKWVGNFKAVKKVLEKHLAGNGVVRMETPDGMAIPGFHTVVETESRPELPDGRILEELQLGYLWRGEVLRVAQVKAVKS